MTPRRYFYETFKSPYFQSEEYKKTAGYRYEQKFERFYDKVSNFLFGR